MIIPGGIIGGIKREIVFGGTLYDAVNATSHTFSGVNFGTERTSRQIVLAWFGNSASSSATIGGAATTSYNPSGVGGAAFFALAAPTGTSGSIVISTPGSQQLAGAYWIAYGFSPTSPSSNNSSDLVAPFTNNATVTLYDRGGWFAFAQSASLTGAMTGITNDFQVSLDANDRIVGGSALSSAGTGTVSVAVQNYIAALSLQPYP
jgi:hypothetical protein